MYLPIFYLAFMVWQDVNLRHFIEDHQYQSLGKTQNGVCRTMVAELTKVEVEDRIDILNAQLAKFCLKSMD